MYYVRTGDVIELEQPAKIGPTTIGLVALGRNGDILHLPWTPESGKAGSPKWRPLGAAPPGALSAEAGFGLMCRGA